MEKLGLRSRQPSAPKYEKASNEHLAVPNILNREFNVKAPNQIWCGDVTYIWIGKRWAYLAIVLDLFSRKPIGLAFSLSPDSQLTSKALMNAYKSRGKPKGVLFHSDQGMHYTSKKLRQTLWHYQIKQSMSRRGNCWGNAPMERFFRGFKAEWMPEIGYQSFVEAERSIINYITAITVALGPISIITARVQMRSKECTGKSLNAWPNLVDHNLPLSEVMIDKEVGYRGELEVYKREIDYVRSLDLDDNSVEWLSQGVPTQFMT